MQNNNGMQRKAKESRAGSRKQPQGGSSDPPQLSTNVRLKHRFRFMATAAQNGPITDTNILGACGTICTVVNSLTTNFTESFKIRKVEVWAAPSSQGSASTCSVDWVGYQNSPNLEESDTTLSVTKNAHIVAVPPQMSLASFWQKSSGTTLFTLVCPANSVIDITLDMIQADQEVALVSNAIATGVIAHTYFLALDGSGTHNLVPVSLNTTF